MMENPEGLRLCLPGRRHLCWGMCLFWGGDGEDGNDEDEEEESLLEAVYIGIVMLLGMKAKRRRFETEDITGVGAGSCINQPPPLGFESPVCIWTVLSPGDSNAPWGWLEPLPACPWAKGKVWFELKCRFMSLSII